MAKKKQKHKFSGIRSIDQKIAKMKRDNVATYLKWWDLEYERNKFGNNTVKWRKARFHSEQKGLQNRKQRLPRTGKNADW